MRIRKASFCVLKHSVPRYWNYVTVGGTITGEHGVGIEKINSMCVQFSREELDAFLR
jgi:FAD/FMN-containing dehydrogenase